MNAPRLIPVLALVTSLLLPRCTGEEPLPPVCVPEARQCQGGKHVEICVSTGDAWEHYESCASYETCVDGACVGDCTPTCEGRECGDDDCEGSCGDCKDGFYCWEGECFAHCEPDCTGKACGDDGCGGECPPCQDGYTCEDHACVPECAPSCVGKECGGDGCGGSCGICEWPEICAGDAVCDCQGWCTGPAGELECGPDGCGGECGGGCDQGELCVNGACVATDACGDPDQYLCGQNCCGADESCSIVDGNGPYCCAEVENAACILRPDGAWEVAWLDSCGEPWHIEEICDADCAAGTCQACVPSCAGAECGGDGCGGSCGTCPAGSGCVDDLCKEGACECEDGPCCEDCAFQGKNVKCEEDAEEEEGCSSTACGGGVAHRNRDRFCSGHTSACDGDLGTWKTWVVDEACAGTEICDPDALTCTAAPTCDEPPLDCDDLVYEAEDNDDDKDANLLASGDLGVCNLHLCAAGEIKDAADADWYYFQTSAAAACPYNLDVSFTQGLEVQVVVRCWGATDKIYYTLPDGAGITCTKLFPGTGPMGPDLPNPGGEAVSCVFTQPGLLADLGCGNKDIGYTPGPSSKVVVGVTRTAQSSLGSYDLELHHSE